MADRKWDQEKDPEDSAPQEREEIDTEEAAQEDTCPRCGGRIDEETERCTKCGHYLIRGAGPAFVRWIILIIVLAAMGALIWGLVAM